MDILIACHCMYPLYVNTTNEAVVMHKRAHILNNNKAVLLTTNDYPTYNIKSVSYVDINRHCKAIPGRVGRYDFPSFTYSYTEKQYTKWDDIPKESMDAIYTVNCPIFMDDGVLESLLIKGWEILREGGSIYLPIKSEEDLERYDRRCNNFLERYDEELKENDIQWDKSQINYNELPHKLVFSDMSTLSLNNRGKYKSGLYSKIIVFTKPKNAEPIPNSPTKSNGGSRRKIKYRKNKYRKTKKNTTRKYK